jgi:hypothetical protein
LSFAISSGKDGLAVSEEKKTAFRDVRTGATLREFQTTSPINAATDLAFDRGGKVLRVSGRQAVSAWNLEAGTPRQPLKVETLPGSKMRAILGHDWELVATESHDSHEVRNTSSGGKVTRLEVLNVQRPLSGVFSGDGHLLALVYGGEGSTKKPSYDLTVLEVLETALAVEMLARHDVSGGDIDGLLPRTKDAPRADQGYGETGIDRQLSLAISHVLDIYERDREALVRGVRDFLLVERLVEVLADTV